MEWMTAFAGGTYWQTPRAKWKKADVLTVTPAKCQELSIEGKMRPCELNVEFQITFPCTLPIPSRVGQRTALVLTDSVRKKASCGGNNAKITFLLCDDRRRFDFIS